jgi:hypothetical protein
MRFAKLCLGLLAAAVVPPASSEAALQCSFSTTPASPSADTEAFGNNVQFGATGRVECLLDDAPTGADVCISARRDIVAGSSAFRRSGATIGYTLRVNDVTVGEADAEVYSGSVPPAGVELPVTYEVASADYAGQREGAYEASFDWTVYFDPGVCDPG